MISVVIAKYMNNRPKDFIWKGTPHALGFGIVDVQGGLSIANLQKGSELAKREVEGPPLEKVDGSEHH